LAGDSDENVGNAGHLAVSVAGPPRETP
jgi:hypothetical protein